MFHPIRRYSPGIVCFISALLLVGFASTCFSANRSTHTIRVMGTGPIVDENTSAAKDKAISNGLIAAVDRVINDELPRHTVIDNFAAINQILFNYTDTFIQGYKVLAEARYENTYRVMIEVVVSEKKVKHRLVSSGIVIDSSSKYKLLILLSEHNLADLTPQLWWADGMSHIRTVSDSTLSDSLKKKGFDVLRHSRLPQNVLQESDAETDPKETLSIEEAVNIGKAFGADIVLKGSAVAEQTPNTMGEERSFTGTINIDIIRTDTGEVIGSISKKSIKVHSDETEGSRDALAETAMAVAGDAASRINIAMKEDENKPSMIEVVIEGQNFFINYSKLNKKLKETPGVTRVRQREKRPNRAIVVVNYIGNGKALAQALMAESYENFGLNISEVTRNRIRVEMVPKSEVLFNQ